MVSQSLWEGGPGRLEMARRSSTPPLVLHADFFSPLLGLRDMDRHFPSFQRKFFPSAPPPLPGLDPVGHGALLLHAEADVPPPAHAPEGRQGGFRGQPGFSIR